MPPTNEELNELSRLANDALSAARAPAQQTARGWISRLLAAGIAYGRGPETAARWEELQIVRRQAEAFFRQREEL